MQVKVSQLKKFAILILIYKVFMKGIVIESIQNAVKYFKKFKSKMSLTQTQKR